MKVLVIGNPANIHIYNIVRNVHVPAGINVTIYSTNGPVENVSSDKMEFYRNNNVKLVDGVRIVEFWKPQYISYLKNVKKKIDGLGYFDYVHMIFVFHIIAPALYLVRNNFGKIVLSYIGSDLYRTGVIRQLLTLPIVKKSSHISLISEDMLNYYRQKNRLYSSHIGKCCLLDVGNMFYDTITKIRQDNYDKKPLRMKMGLDPERLVVTIGYVGRPQMQQVRCLKEILKLDSAVLNKIQLVFPAYGINPSDELSLNRLIEDSGVKGIVYPQFMGPKEVSELRVATDIFVHGQTTDALSCAMLEHLYAGSIVLNGEWLNYEALTNNHIYYKKFKDMESLSSVLSDMIDNFEFEREKSVNNQSIVHRISSWDTLRAQWLNLYD